MRKLTPTQKQQLRKAAAAVLEGNVLLRAQMAEAGLPGGERRVSDRRAVDHPQHYGGDVPHETVKCLEAWGLEADALLWNAAKYISRAGKKGEQLEDLKKARWYLDRRIAALEAKS